MTHRYVLSKSYKALSNWEYVIRWIVFRARFLTFDALLHSVKDSRTPTLCRQNVHLHQSKSTCSCTVLWNVVENFGGIIVVVVSYGNMWFLMLRCGVLHMVFIKVLSKRKQGMYQQLPICSRKATACGGDCTAPGRCKIVSLKVETVEYDM